MLLKPRVKNKLYDVLHQSVVSICMGVTVIGFGYISYRGYKYFTEIKPNLKAEQLRRIKEGNNDDGDTAEVIVT